MASHFNEELWYSPDAQQERAVEEKAAKGLAAKVGRIVGAKPFPLAARKLGELTRDQNCPIERVVAVLESDPALSAKLLRLVNSSGFALRTACTSVSHAATLVGLRRLHQVATTAAILDMVEAKSDIAAQTLEHGAVVAALCRYLAGHVGLPPDDLFTCGFLHDIGKVILLDSEGDEYRALLEETLDQPDTAHVRERLLLGYDHAVLGGHVLTAWNIPAPVPRVIAWHHQVARAYDDPQLAKMISTLRLADAASQALFHQFPDFEIERLARTEAASYLEVSEPQLAAMWDEMLAVAVRARATFRGEAVPEVEPRPRRGTSAHPSRQVQALVEEAPRSPCNFPCVACGVPTYANTCRACRGYVCPTHHQNDDEWCTLCVQHYESLRISLPPWVYASLGSAIGAMLVGTFVGASGAVTGRSLTLMVAPGLVSLLVVVMFWVWQRWLRRMWFMRTCPNRQSLAPPVTREAQLAAAQVGADSGMATPWVNPFPIVPPEPVIRTKGTPLPTAPFMQQRPRRGDQHISLRPSMHVQGEPQATRRPFDRLVRSSTHAPGARPQSERDSTPPPRSQRRPSGAAAARSSDRPKDGRAASRLVPSLDDFDDPFEVER